MNLITIIICSPCVSLINGTIADYYNACDLVWLLCNMSLCIVYRRISDWRRSRRSGKKEKQKLRISQPARGILLTTCCNRYEMGLHSATGAPNSKELTITASRACKFY